MKRSMVARCFLIVLSLVVLVPAFSAYAEDVTEKTLVGVGSVEKANDYFSTQTFTYSDGTSISRDVISGPPTPPPGYESERAEAQLPARGLRAATSTLTVPAYDWVFGCSAVSGSMIAAYYDRNGYSKIYTGPTGGGVMPLDSSGWGTWTDINSDVYPNNPLIASHNGVDGRTTKGSIDDCWIQYGNTADDPYVTGHWSQHKWKDAIGDYMKTSQSAYDNSDGSTQFWNYTTSANQLTCADMAKLKANSRYTISHYDGTYGRKLFYEARGYKVTDCYNQKTDNTVSGGFSFAQYKAEIDAGRPVFLNLAGHSIVGVGYDDSSNTVYVHDTWDYITHSMTWGGSYSGMELLSVSVVTLKEVHPAISALSPSSGTFGNTVIIKGKYFGDTEGSVTFNGTTAAVSSWSDISITCTVPVSAATGSVVVTTDLGGPSVGKKFTVKNPLISGFNPASGTIGATVIIKGKYFGTTEGTVTFNSTTATVSSWSDTSITCTVPGSATTGSVVVTNQVGPSNAKKFTVK
jgi:hypothetical protein